MARLRNGMIAPGRRCHWLIRFVIPIILVGLANVLCISADRFKTFNEVYKHYFPKTPSPHLLAPNLALRIRWTSSAAANGA